MSAPLPASITDFVNTICNMIDTFADSVEIACHVNADSDVCELSIFPITQEVVGGPNDGQRMQPPFSLDVMSALLTFDHVQSVRWKSAPFADDDELGNHIVIEGDVAGHQVWVNLLSRAPDRFETQPRDGLAHRV